MTSIEARRIAIVSRCSWTMHSFRLSLIRSLMERNYAVKAVGAGGDGYDLKLLAAGVDFEHVPVSRRGISPLIDLWLLVRLVMLFRRVRPQVFHGFTIKPVIYGTLAAAIVKVPVRVVTITGLGHAFTTASGVLRRVVETLYRVALGRASLVFFQNADDRNLFLERGLVTAEKTRLIAGSGVDTARFAVAPLPLASGASPRFLMIARMLREKGVLEYLTAAAEVRKVRPDAEFALLGGIDSRNPSGLSREQVGTLAATAGVRWIDQVSDVRPHLADSDVLVLPSYREGMPRVVLEAAAMGRPAIVTDVPGCRDAVVAGITGLLVPVADAGALARAMLELMNEPNRVREMGVAARRHIEAEFDETVVIRETISAYQELIR